jgi:D-alanyl-D-alanine carboxypeptidase/D-alanyl-D-alanine carboxypeptidase (penicillin-binding protein 5/6)
MNQPLFRKIVATLSHPWIAPSTGQRELTNHNKLLRNFPGATGVKTGYTNPAQHTLTSAALWGTDEMICAVMHATKQGKWDDSKLLITYAFEHRWDPEATAAEATPTTADSR